MTDPIVISMISLTCFLVASGLLVLGFKGPARHMFWIRCGYFLFVVGTLAATLEALQTWSTPHLLSAAVAWATIISWFVWHMELIGAFTAPVIVVTLLSGIFFSAQNPQSHQPILGPGLGIHIASAVIGQTFAILACGMSLLYLWLDKKLKKRQLSDLPDSFPAMTTITKALTMMLWIGFTFITVSLLSGAMYALTGGISQSPAIYPKVAWAILVWVWYLSILVLKGILGYRPQRVARMSLAGFLIMAISWFGILFVAPWGAS